MSWKCNEEPYSRKKKGPSVPGVTDRPNKGIEIRPLDLPMCRLLVTFMISFDRIGSREN